MSTPATRYVTVLPDVNAQALDHPFSYSWPSALGTPRVGQVVKVELGRRQVTGFLLDDAAVVEADTRDKLKAVLSLRDDACLSAGNIALAKWIASEYLCPLAAALHLFLPITEKPKRPRRVEPATVPPDQPKLLNDEQQQALETICAALDVSSRPILLDGVTGSGKTEVYLQAIATVLARGGGAICLVPEISLTPQTVSRFRARFGDKVAVLHSRMSKGARYSEWQRLRCGQARVAVGPRSALFAPVADLGLVIIDEEHEYSYKQGNAPRYVSRDVAEQLCRIESAGLVLGSATPSLETLSRAAQGHYQHLRLSKRATGATAPQVRIVDLSLEFKQGNKTMISVALAEALRQTMARRRKAILLLNRRGFASFLLCRDCGFVPTCANCSTSLTLHQATGHLECHTCGLQYPIPPRCPECGSRYIARFGKGTEFAEADLHQLLGPDLPLIRMDADSTRRRDGHEQRLREFAEAPYGILLGTQMIAKGLDFPEVSLVGVLLADTGLKIPDFRAAERSYDLFEQVAGRSGRAGDVQGQVIIQTYEAQHIAVKAVKAGKRSLFTEGELTLRQSLGYPPFSRLCNIVFDGRTEAEVQEQAQAFCASLHADAAYADQGIAVLGPAACTIARIKGRYRWHVLLKAPLGYHFRSFGFKPPRTVRMTVDVDPYDLM
ncbi:MAG: primosomal protein N' [Coriobacteriales bacterium]|jgi:primosomal protein N' (replication factor Y)|nr:primosomal protein N' [Coriobacteriales bacterium]